MSRNDPLASVTLEPLRTPRRELRGLHVPRSHPGPGYELAFGSDGTTFLSAQFDALDFADIPKTRRVFVGIAREDNDTFANGVLEFARRHEPRVLALNGKVYVQCKTRQEIIDAQTSGLPMFYGYSATARQEKSIQHDLVSLAGEIHARVPSRPRVKKRRRRRQQLVH